MILEQGITGSMGGTNVQISSKMVKLGGGDLGLVLMRLHIQQTQVKEGLNSNPW